MKVFLSWSGDLSRRVACALRDWLPTVLHYAEPWVSSEDIDKGARWFTEIGRELDEAQFGIICLTPENVHEPWVLFEAGAMSRSLDSARVSPFLAGLTPSQITGPLAQFQCTVFTKGDVAKLLHSINKCASAPIPISRVDSNFRYSWPGLEQGLKPLLDQARAATPRRSAAKAPGAKLHDKQVEILVILSNSGEKYLTTEQIASCIKEKLAVTQYHLDQLKARQMINDLISMYSPTRYYVKASGRAFVVENGLI